MIRFPKWFAVVLALALLIGLSAPCLAAEAQGKIKTVAADKNELVMTDANGKDWTFQLDPNGKVSVGAQAAQLKDLKPNQEVTITYDKVGEKLIAKEIKCEK
jgi:hypothetical protein